MELNQTKSESDWMLELLSLVYGQPPEPPQKVRRVRRTIYYVPQIENIFELQMAPALSVLILGAFLAVVLCSWIFGGRDAHTPLRLPTYRDLVEPHSRIQAGAKSVAAPLVCSNALNIEMLTEFQPVNTLGNLGVLALLLNSRTESQGQEDRASETSARERAEGYRQFRVA